MLDQRWRTVVERKIRPLGSRLRQAGITADQVTLIGLAASVACGLALAGGHFHIAAAALFVAGCTDVLDGAVAKAGGTAGPRGAFFDSVADRVSDAVVMAGAAWYLAGRDPQLTLLPFAVASLSFLVSYERSKAEGLGLDGKGGLMERAERMFVLGLGLIFGLFLPALWLLCALTSVTVVQRFIKVWRQVPAPVSSGTPRAPGRPVEDDTRGWWVTARPVRSDETRLAGWRWAASPPGDRERSRLVRWWLSAGPPAAHDGRRWWSSSRPAGAGVRSQLRRLRSRTRP